MLTCAHMPSPRRRLLQNPAYYDLEDATPEGVSAYLSQLVEAALTDLTEAGCVTVRTRRSTRGGSAGCWASSMAWRPRRVIQGLGRVPAHGVFSAAQDCAPPDTALAVLPTCIL